MILTPANILLPDIDINDNNSWEAYSVIACDQFTSEPEYWKAAEKISSGRLTTLDFILPEAYLGGESEKNHADRVARSMQNGNIAWSHLDNCMIAVDRTLPDGKVRHGIVGKIDLEEYDFTADSKSAVRATEETVVSRIPPRVKIREAATLEFPHIMIFSDDTDGYIKNAVNKTDENLVYDFELMQGGGHIKGWKIADDDLKKLISGIEKYENSKSGGVVYAMGDGNHSLASAKAFYESVKNKLGECAKHHPSRYALAEIVDLGESAIEFEPIYRLVTNCDTADLLSFIEKHTKNDADTVTVLTKEGRYDIPAPAGHALTVGALQNIIDEYLKAHPEASCDYIHGKDSLEKLSKAEKTVGFLFEGIAKSELFSYVTKNGCLPRKTFSMGEARSKRYYLEARKITE